MDNNYISKYDIQVRLWKEKNTAFNRFFIDDDIILNAKFAKWNNTKVTQMEFSLSNIMIYGPSVPQEKKIYYKICHISECEKDVWGKFILIHLSKNVQNSINPIPFRSSDILGDPNYIKPFNLATGSYKTFLFKVYPDTCSDAVFNCDLNGGDPKTKDGTIIISG